MNEKVCWTVAVGNLPTRYTPRAIRKRALKAVHYTMGLEGFVAFYPSPPDGTLCLFDSENNAKRARNLMEAKGIRCGRNICRCTVDQEDIDAARELAGWPSGTKEEHA